MEVLGVKTLRTRPSKTKIRRGPGGEARKTQECNFFFSARSSEIEVSNFKQPFLGSVKVREVF